MHYCRSQREPYRTVSAIIPTSKIKIASSAGSRYLGSEYGPCQCQKLLGHEMSLVSRHTNSKTEEEPYC